MEKEIKKITNDELALRTIQRYYIPKKAKPIFNNDGLKKLLDKGEITKEQYEFFKFKVEYVDDIFGVSGQKKKQYWPRRRATYRVTKRRYVEETATWLDSSAEFRSIPFLNAEKFIRNTIPWQDGYEKVNINKLDFASGRFFLECRYSKNPYGKAPVMRQIKSLNELSSTIEEYINDKLDRISHTLNLIELEGIQA